MRKERGWIVIEKLSERRGGSPLRPFVRALFRCVRAEVVLLMLMRSYFVVLVRSDRKDVVVVHPLGLPDRRRVSVSLVCLLSSFPLSLAAPENEYRSVMSTHQPRKHILDLDSQLGKLEVKWEVVLVDAEGVLDLRRDPFDAHEGESDERDDEYHKPAHVVHEDQGQREKVEEDALFEVDWGEGERNGERVNLCVRTGKERE
jgi:hypothetical protein